MEMYCTPNLECGRVVVWARINFAVYDQRMNLLRSPTKEFCRDAGDQFS